MAGEFLDQRERPQGSPKTAELRRTFTTRAHNVEGSKSARVMLDAEKGRHTDAAHPPRRTSCPKTSIPDAPKLKLAFVNIPSCTTSLTFPCVLHRFGMVYPFGDVRLWSHRPAHLTAALAEATAADDSTYMWLRLAVGIFALYSQDGAPVWSALVSTWPAQRCACPTWCQATLASCARSNASRCWRCSIESCATS
jgi:hypothetical protein